MNDVILNLPLVGSICIVVSMLFTLYIAAHPEPDKKGQSLKDSLLETWTNIVVGFSINWTLNITVFPAAGYALTLDDAFWASCIYTLAAVVRGFCIRRYHNRKQSKETVHV